jgi:FkbM family methyltransferase
MWKRVARSLLSKAGFHIQRKSECPQFNLVGLGRIPFATILDVGANEGQFAREFMQHFPGAAFFCFEPLAAPYERLAGWAAGQRNVKTFNFALGDGDRTAEIFAHTDHTPSSSLLKTTDYSSSLYPFTVAQKSETIEIRTLDGVMLDVLAAEKSPVLMKLDVQGFEKHVLRGGRGVLAKTKACIVEVSLDALYEGQSTFREIFAEMDAAGFSYAGNFGQVHAADGHVIYLDAVFIRN